MLSESIEASLELAKQSPCTARAEEIISLLETALEKSKTFDCPCKHEGV